MREFSFQEVTHNYAAAIINISDIYSTLNMTSYLIYKYTCKTSGKAYIGQTCNLVARSRTHKGSTGCRLFSNAIRKYGWEDFNLEVLEENLTLADANTRESQYIAAHNTLAPNGYNLQTGGANRVQSEETKQLIRIANADRSEEHRRKLSAARLGPLNPNYGKVGTRTGRTRSAETQRRLDVTLSERKNDANKMAVLHANMSVAKAGDRNPNAQMWTIEFEDGRPPQQIKALKAWCNANGYTFAAVYRLVRRIEAGRGSDTWVEGIRASRE